MSHLRWVVTVLALARVLTSEPLAAATINVARAGTPEATTADFICDGIDDQVEINAAVAQAAASGGGTVHLAPGLYALQAPIVVLGDGVTLEGVPGQTTIQAANGFLRHYVNAVFLPGLINFVGVDNFACRGLIVDSATIGIVTNGIVITTDGPDFTGNSSTNGVIEDNHVLTEQAHNYSVWNIGGNHIVIRGNLIDGGSTPDDNSFNQEGIESLAGFDVLIAGNTIRNIGNAAVNIGEVYDVTPEDPWDGVRILNNTIEYSRTGVHLGAVIYEPGGSPRPVVGVHVIGNTIRQISEFGIVVKAYYGDPTTPLHVRDILISDNTIELIDVNTEGLPSVGGGRATGVLVIDDSEPGGTEFENIVVRGNQIQVAAGDHPMNLSPVAPFVWNGGPARHARIVFSGIDDFTVSENTVGAAGTAALLVHRGGAFTLGQNDFGGAPAMVDQLGPITFEGFGFADPSDIRHATAFGSNGTVLNLGSNEQLLFLGKTLVEVNKINFAFSNSSGPSPVQRHDSRVGHNLSGDFDGDGRDELLWRDLSGRLQSAELLVNNTYKRTALNEGPIPFTWQVVGTGDFDGDGCSDILWHDKNGFLAVWYRGLSGLGVVIGQTGDGWQVLGTGDFDGNGRTDILLRKAETGQLGVTWSTAGQYNGSTITGSPDGSFDVVGSGDFDGDGTDDLLWIDSNGQLSIARFAHQTLSTLHNAGFPLGSWNLVGTGDVNRDGLTDILFWNANGRVAVWFMRPDLSFSAAYIGPTVNTRGQYYLAGVGDVNGDGTADLTWLADGSVATWTLDGITPTGYSTDTPTLLQLLQ